MKLTTYNILFRLFSFLADRTNGAPLFSKYKLLLGTLIIGITSTSAQVEIKERFNAENTPNLKDFPTRHDSTLLQNISDSIKINGQVLDEMREPICGASVVIKGTNKGTIANIDGYFNMMAHPEDILEFSFIGYQKKEISARQLIGGTAIVSLKESEDILCYEVVIVDIDPRYRYADNIYRKAARNINKSKISYQEVQTPPISPVGDLKKFQDWVQNNIHYSQQMKDYNIKGDVIISFAIDKKGSITDKKVIGKLSKEADKEALRVLSSSEKWIPGMQNGIPIKTTMTIVVTFEDK